MIGAHDTDAHHPQAQWRARTSFREVHHVE
jgi:hypothetical protein